MLGFTGSQAEYRTVNICSIPIRFPTEIGNSLLQYMQLSISEHPQIDVRTEPKEQSL